MTKRRPPGSFEAAIATVVDAIGAEAAGDTLGKSAALVYKAADPEAPYMLNLEQAVLLDQVCVDSGRGGVPPILGAYIARLSADTDIPPILGAYIARLSADTDIPVGRFQSVKDELLDLPKANAEFVASVLKAHRLGDLSPNIKHEVLAMLEQYIQELREVVYALEHEAAPRVRAAE